MKNYEIGLSKNLDNKTIVSKNRKLAFLVEQVYLKLKSGYQRMETKLGEVQVDVAETKEDARIVRDAYNEGVSARINNVVETKEQELKEVQNTGKPYTVLVKESEIALLKKQAVKEATAPRLLIISEVFISKLIANRQRKMINDLEVKVNNEPLPVTNNEIDPVDEYMELMDRRAALLAEKAEIEAKLVALAKSGKVTQDMINERQSVKGFAA